MSECILSVENLSVSYGAIDAVRDLSLDLSQGEIISFVGPNGAGKSSTMNAIVKLVPSSGVITFGGESLAGVTTEGVVKRGLTLCPEGRQVFPDLTVEENLLVGSYSLTSRQARSDKLEQVADLFPVLTERQTQKAGTLSGGEQQMLAIGRALMSGPRVLLLDEPSLGLAPKIVDQIFDLIGRLRDNGYTIILVEQNVELALEISDRGYVLVNGEIQMSGSASALLEDSDIRDAYFGVG